MISILEPATKDDEIEFILVGNLHHETDEIWIEGDLMNDAAGRWDKIPKELKIPRKIQGEDGLKQFRVKVRNIYGTESEGLVELNIVKNTIAPSHCFAVTPSKFTNLDKVPVYISAQSNLEYQY